MVPGRRGIVNARSVREEYIEPAVVVVIEERHTRAHGFEEILLARRRSVILKVNPELRGGVDEMPRHTPKGGRLREDRNGRLKKECQRRIPDAPVGGKRADAERENPLVINLEHAAARRSRRRESTDYHTHQTASQNAKAAAEAAAPAHATLLAVPRQNSNFNCICSTLGPKSRLLGFNLPKPAVSYMLKSVGRLKTCRLNALMADACRKDIGALGDARPLHNVEILALERRHSNGARDARHRA